MKTIKINQKCNFWKIIFLNFPKSVENRFRQVPQVDLDLQNSNKIVKIAQIGKFRLNSIFFEIVSPKLFSYPFSNINKNLFLAKMDLFFHLFSRGDGFPNRWPDRTTETNELRNFIQNFVKK